MTKVMGKIKSLIDPKNKGFRHTMLFKILIGFVILVLLGVVYNVFIRRSSTSRMTDDEKQAAAARAAALDTLDVVGDYLWPDVKQKTEEKKEETPEEEETVEHVKEKPVAEAATEEDLEEDAGQTPTDETTPATEEPAKDKKSEPVKVEKMDKPTVEEIE